MGVLFFTVCTIQNLAEAMVLGDSLQAQSADYQLVTCILDEKNRIPETINLPHKIIEISEIGLEKFDEMNERYSQTELLANIKPFVAGYLFQKFPDVDKLIYFDANSLIFNDLTFIFQQLDENNIVIVPQITQANRHPDEKQVLNSGIFHAGFFALKRSAETMKFLHWWQERVATKGFIQLCKGMNADQLWLEHVPIFFEKVVIEKHEGLNVGAWNLAERKLQELAGGEPHNQWFSNDSPLISFNFKGSKYWKSYRQQLNNYHPQELLKIEPIFGQKVKQKKSTFFSKSLRNFSKKIDVLMDKIS